MSDKIYCYYITTEDKISEMLVSYVSLLSTGTSYPVGCIVGKQISEEAKSFLTEIGLIVLDGSAWDLSEQIKDESGKIVSEMICSGKLSMYQFTQFKKIVYLDSDTYVLKNIDELFNYKDGSMVRLFFLPPANRICNGGLLVCEPSLKIIDELKKSISDGREIGKFEYYDDQDFLMRRNDYPNRSDIGIPAEYNVFPFYIDEYRNNPMFEEKSTKMVHWMGSVTIAGINYKVYNTPTLGLHPALDVPYLVEYMKQYNLIISIYQQRYPNAHFLQKCVFDPFMI